MSTYGSATNKVTYQSRNQSKFQGFCAAGRKEEKYLKTHKKKKKKKKKNFRENTGSALERIALLAWNQALKFLVGNITIFSSFFC